MSKMFEIAGKRMKTWNPFSGCNFLCSYCFARKIAEGRARRFYPGGFIPTAHPERFKVHFKPGEWVFVCDMADVAFAPQAVWGGILDVVRKHPDTKFLMQSKAPRCFRDRVPVRPDNLYFGTTIETNRWAGYGDFSSAPWPRVRYQDMVDLGGPRLVVSIEPIMDLDVKPLEEWLAMISPAIVFVGADNYHCGLPEPSWEKVQQLLEGLRKFVPQVIEKQGLERLRNA